MLSGVWAPFSRVIPQLCVTGVAQGDVCLRGCVLGTVVFSSLGVCNTRLSRFGVFCFASFSYICLELASCNDLTFS